MGRNKKLNRSKTRYKMVIRVEQQHKFVYFHEPRQVVVFEPSVVAGPKVLEQTLKLTRREVRIKTRTKRMDETSGYNE